jgi:hypothetical protein
METQAIAWALGYGGLPADGALTIPAKAPRPAVELFTIGIRAVNLPAGLSADSVSGIIVAGLGGALEPALAVGDVIVDGETGNVPEAYRRRKIYTSATLVSSVDEKKRLFEQTGASVVDMETAIVREHAAKLGVGVLAIRAISDAADHAIHPAVATFVDPVGNPKPASIALGLARRPWLIGQMLRLNAHSSLALNNLGAAVAAIVDHGAKRGAEAPEATG